MYRSLVSRLTLVVASIALSFVGLSTPSAAAASLTVAEAPGAAPTEILPFMSCQYDTPSNVQDFQQLMFRPLYWYGLGSAVTEQPALSPAAPPVFNKASTQAVITLKPWRFANGEVLSAQNVMFFLNLWRANPSAYCATTPGYALPDVLRSAVASGNKLTLTFFSPVNHSWLLGNLLSEVTPLALTWDHGTTNASGGCARGAYGAASTVTACLDVLSYLTAQSTITSDFTSSFWQGGVDGPYKLSALSPTGNATFVANPTYAGPQRPRVATLTMVAFSSLAREEAALATNALAVGYVSATDVAPTSKVGQAGSNAQAYATHYNLSVASPWGFNEITLNADVTGASQALLAQPYIRQALASSIDQSSMITSALRGYGLVTSSPLPASASALGAPKKNPWPFSLVNARSTLASHGWTLTGATLTCTSPGTSATQCGAGVTSGQPLSLPLVAASGDVVLSNELKTWSSDLAAMGVALNVTYDTISHVWGDCGIASAYALCASGQGWSYLGAHYPSGEALFGVGAASNLGGISDASLATLVENSTRLSSSLAAYAAYAAQSLPVLYLPTPETLVETSKALVARSALVPNPLGSFTPEYWALR